MSIIWITGLAGTGKTTLADRVAALLGSAALRIDGDAVRRQLGEAGRGYARAQRLAVARHIAELALRSSRGGACAVVATISLFHEIHAFNRACGEDYFEVLLDCPAAVRAQRRAVPLDGPQVGAEIAAEFPLQPHLRLDSAAAGADALAAQLLQGWQRRHV